MRTSPARKAPVVLGEMRISTSPPPVPLAPASTVIQAALVDARQEQDPGSVETETPARPPPAPQFEEDGETVYRHVAPACVTVCTSRALPESPCTTMFAVRLERDGFGSIEYQIVAGPAPRWPELIAIHATEPCSASIRQLHPAEVLTDTLSGPPSAPADCAAALIA